MSAPCVGNARLYDIALFGGVPAAERDQAIRQTAALCAACPTPCEQKITDTGTPKITGLDPDWTMPACCKGDRASYQAHCRRGEVPCEASTAAERAYQRTRKDRTGNARSEPSCGTYSGYLAHKKRNEPACDSCKEAKRAYDRERYARNPRKARAPQLAYEARQRAARQGVAA